MNPTEPGKRTRLTELSLLNVFFCLLVIFIHVSSAPVTVLERPSWQLLTVFIPWKLASFVVYGFLFLGGVKFGLHPYADGGLGRYYRGRFLGVIVPYLVWTLVYCLLNAQAGWEPFSIRTLLTHIVDGGAAGQLYYIVITAQFYLLAPLWKRLLRRNPAVVLPMALLLTLFCDWYLEGIFSGVAFPIPLRKSRLLTTYAFYWIAGLYAGQNWERFSRTLRESAVGIRIAFVLAAAAEVLCGYRSFVGAGYVPYDALLHTIYICTAILFTAEAAVRLTKTAAGEKLGQSVGFRLADRAAFAVYLSHIFVMRLWDTAAGHFWGGASTAVLYLMRIAVTYAVSWGVCLVWVRLRETVSRHFS